MSKDSFFINLWVTYRCNFRCRYCYVKSKYQEKDLLKSTANGVIDFIKSNIKAGQSLIINFHGGEPLLNLNVIKHIISRIEAEINNPCLFGITTNGSLLDNESIDYVSKHFKFNTSISLDGKKETNEFNRQCISGNVDFNIIVKNALKLLKKNGSTRIRMTFDNKNIISLYDNIRYFIDLGFRIIVPVADYYCKEWSSNDFDVVKLQFEKVKEYIQAQKLTDVSIQEISNEFQCLSPCGAGDDYYSIDAYGDIYPCTLLVGDEKHLLGNVFDGINKNQLGYIHSINSKKITECESCKLYNYCLSTRCLLVNYATMGDYYKPNLVQCNMLNVRLQLSSD